MSLSIALHNALSGLQTNEAMIQVISNNVTNANVEGYTHKISQPASVTLAGDGRGVEAGESTIGFREEKAVVVAQWVCARTRVSELSTYPRRWR